MGYQNGAHYKPFASEKKTKVKVENATERRRRKLPASNILPKIWKPSQSGPKMAPGDKWGAKREPLTSTFQS